MSFLRAEWRRLAIANYCVDPQVLLPLVPEGTQLDTWNGKCYVSLVGFLFRNTRLKGIKVPFHVNFPEVNLRFYVVREFNGERRRGVVFIREIVNKPALSFVANTIYKEHYTTMPMRYSWESEPHETAATYAWKKAGKWNRLSVQADKNTSPIEPGSEAEFITEHYWGYAGGKGRRTNEYEVTHPRWEHYPVSAFEIDVDWASCYGTEFRFLSQLEPASVFLAEGSEITVEPKKTLLS